LKGLIGIGGPSNSVEIAGIRLVGVNTENGRKLLLTLAFILVAIVLGRILRGITSLIFRGRNEDADFWSRQIIRLLTAVVVIVGIMSIWFDNPARLATALGLVTAGLAFALQKVVTAVAGYFVLLRGKNFSVGDRITMGGVRGDVIALSFIQTTIMEMGQPPAVQNADPAMWVKSRQYTGRIVTVSNARIFDEPVYNYTRDFPYLWEEMSLPIKFDSDHKRAERILLEAAERHTVEIKALSKEALGEMKRRYFMTAAEMGPRVYYRWTDNWLELTVRFVAEDHGVRELKDSMTREIMAKLEEAGIGLASTTIAVVEIPKVKVELERGADQR